MDRYGKKGITMKTALTKTITKFAIVFSCSSGAISLTLGAMEVEVMTRHKVHDLKNELIVQLKRAHQLQQQIKNVFSKKDFENTLQKIFAPFIKNHLSIEQKFDLLTLSAAGKNALWWAVFKQDYSLTSFLLKDLSVHQRYALLKPLPEDGNSVIMVATCIGNLPLLTLLLEGFDALQNPYKYHLVRGGAERNWQQQAKALEKTLSRLNFQERYDFVRTSKIKDDYSGYTVNCFLKAIIDDNTYVAATCVEQLKSEHLLALLKEDNAQARTPLYQIAQRNSLEMAQIVLGAIKLQSPCLLKKKKLDDLIQGIVVSYQDQLIPSIQKDIFGILGHTPQKQDLVHYLQEILKKVHAEQLKTPWMPTKIKPDTRFIFD